MKINLDNYVQMNYYLMLNMLKYSWKQQKSINSDMIQLNCGQSGYFLILYYNEVPIIKKLYIQTFFKEWTKICEFYFQLHVHKIWKKNNFK